MSCQNQVAIEDPKQLLFGNAPRPVSTKDGLNIGGGLVYPELNFTLPAMTNVSKSTMPEVRQNYQDIIADATKRAAELDVPGLVVEFETLPPMVETPQWSEELVKILLDGMADARAEHGLRSALRYTPNDIREMTRPPEMRRGQLYQNMMSSFEKAAAAGADMLSIESVGGKEVTDDALTWGDLPAVLFGLTVLGVRDMDFLWGELKNLANEHDCVCAGDTACGFANTAMVLAEKQYIPRVFAAVVRAISVVRSLVAYKKGAIGPGKDCGYENVFLKAITGYPMSMEGKAASCAHASPLGNIAGACCDLWSNESVQNVKLLGGPAPTCSLEQLTYDCRLFNEAAREGRDGALHLRNWLVRSDYTTDPQAYIMAPENVLAIAHAVTAEQSSYRAGCAAALKTIELLRDAHNENTLHIGEREEPWLDMMQHSIESLPAEENAFIREMIPRVDTERFILSEYGLENASSQSGTDGL